jgi:hypothetical protein
VAAPLIRNSRPARRCPGARPAKSQKQIAELADVVTEKGEQVVEALADFNNAFALKLDALEKARSAYNAAIADLRGIIQDLADEAQAYFDERSERWQASEAGNEYGEWAVELAEAAERLPDLEEFEIEEMDEPALFDGDSFVWPPNEPG